MPSLRIFSPKSRGGLACRVDFPSFFFTIASIFPRTGDVRLHYLCSQPSPPPVVAALGAAGRSPVRSSVPAVFWPHIWTHSRHAADRVRHRFPGSVALEALSCRRYVQERRPWFLVPPVPGFRIEFQRPDHICTMYRCPESAFGAALTTDVPTSLRLIGQKV
jgi:hypothetical protein